MKPTRTITLILVTAALLASCGTTEEARNPTSTTTGQNTGTGPITLVDDRGEEVTLDAPAERVVALEWMQAENLVTLGVMPVGVADVENYRIWNEAGPLDDDVADVGTRTEPSEDTILDLEPDLIIMEADRSSDLPERLERYAPVIVVAGSDGEDNWANMRSSFELIARAVGADDRAEEVLADLDEKIAEGAGAIAEAAPEMTTFVIADGYFVGSTLVVRVYGQDSQLSEAAERLGLTNAWPGSGDDWGLDETDLEGLTVLGDLQFFYAIAGDEDPIADGTLGSRTWDGLPFVANGHVTRVTPGMWPFGGPASMEMLVDQLVAAFAA